MSLSVVVSSIFQWHTLNGYFLDGSSGPNILTETDVLACGSLNGSLEVNTPFDLRVHPTLCLPVWELHLKQFLSEHSVPQNVMTELKTLSGSVLERTLREALESEDVLASLRGYDHFIDETLSGPYGKTELDDGH